MTYHTRAPLSLCPLFDLKCVYPSPLGLASNRARCCTRILTEHRRDSNTAQHGRRVGVRVCGPRVRRTASLITPRAMPDSILLFAGFPKGSECLQTVAIYPILLQLRRATELHPVKPATTMRRRSRHGWLCLACLLFLGLATPCRSLSPILRPLAQTHLREPSFCYAQCQSWVLAVSLVFGFCVAQS